MRDGSRFWSVAAVLLLLVGCGGDGEPQGSVGGDGGGARRAEPIPDLRDDLVAVSPDPVAPGAVVEVTFAEPYPRGVAWQLVDGAGEVRWWMTSDANGGEPTTVAAGTDGYGWEDVGIGGTGPDRVLVDPATEPGFYRLCTANAVDDVCVGLTVAAG